MKRDSDNWKKSVEELTDRLDRCENYVLNELSESLNMASKDQKTHKYRDRNTLVEVTVHTRGKSKETGRNVSWDRSLEKENDPKSFAKPTRASSGKAVTTNSPKQIKRKKSLENRPDKKAAEDDVAKQKTIRQLLEELKGSFKESGVKDFYEFLDEVDGGRSRSERKTVESTKSPKKVQVVETKCQKLEHKEIDEDVRRLGVELKRYKSECARYKNEYDIVQKQLLINKDSQASMETQINDLKKIISKLTHNNSELLGLVSDRAGQEDQLTEAEQKLTAFARQLEAEKSRVKHYEARFLEQESEISKLRRLTSDLKTHLHHGLAGLDVPRSRPASIPQDQTRDILGLTNMSEAFKGNHSQSEDSAIEDPESRQSSTPRGATRYNSHPIIGATNQNKNKIVAPNNQNKNQVVAPNNQNKNQVVVPNNQNKNSTVFPTQKNKNPKVTSTQQNQNPSVSGINKPFSNPPYSKHNALPDEQQKQPTLTINDKPSVPMPGTLPTLLPQHLPTNLPPPQHLPTTHPSSLPPPQHPPYTHPSSLPPPYPSQSFTMDHLKNPNQMQTHNIDENFQETIYENLPNLNPQTFHPDSHTTAAAASFQPIPLDLSDTLSSNADLTQLTGVEYEPATVASKPTNIGLQLKQNPHIGLQQNLENKVQAFLDKLHQDSLNLSLPELPKARSFQGPTMQLSISGCSDLDDTRDTTLTEGKFLRGLETSIEVLPTEITHSSN